jgi:SAM-dependent methyltransferase
MDKEIRDKYFGNNWNPNYDHYKYSGWALLDKVEPEEEVLDIGCGFNLFKDAFGDRLHGIDPANTKADELVGIMEFETDKRWDVAFALGSLNFGTAEDVEPQVEKAISLLKPGGRIYWRQNPGLGDHPWKGMEEIVFFPWSMQLNYEWADKYKCVVVECKWDAESDRIYAEWKKSTV